MKSPVIIILLFVAIVYAVDAIAMPENNVILAENRTVTISNVVYDYTIWHREDQQADCIGTISFDVTFPPGALRVLTMKTMPHMAVLNENPIYVGKGTSFVDKNTVCEHVIIPSTSWGTFIRAQVVYEDSDNPVSLHINSSDYLSEEDRLAIFGTLDSPQIHDNNSRVEITPDGEIAITSLIGGNIWLYNINGQCVMAESFHGSSVTSLPEFSSSMYILKIKFDDNSLITRKIIH